MGVTVSWTGTISYMDTLRRWIIQNRWLVMVLVVILVFFSYLVFANGKVGDLPQSFWDARKSAAGVSQEIRDLTTRTSDAIASIEISDKKDVVAKTRALIEEARINNSEAYKRAFVLSQDLKKIAESLHLIESRRLQQAAYQAVATELSLVSEFINYTQYLNSFLSGMEMTLKSYTPENVQLVEQMRREINREVETINDLNEEFLEMMGRFDSAL